MRKRDLRSNVKVKKALNAAISTDTTTNGDWIDTKGYRSVMFQFFCVARSAGTFTPALQDSDAAAHGDAADIADTYLVGLESENVLDAANEVVTIGYAGKRRYVRPRIVSGSSGNGTIVCTVLLGDPVQAPVTQGVGA